MGRPELIHYSDNKEEVAYESGKIIGGILLVAAIFKSAKEVINALKSDIHVQYMVISARLQMLRTPYIQSVGYQAQELAEVEGHIVAAKQDRMLVTAFHPKLANNLAIHEYFLKMAKY